KKLAERGFIALFVVFLNTGLSAQIPLSNKPNNQTQPPSAQQVVTLPSAFANEISINYVETKTALAPITNLNSFTSATYQNVSTVFEYFDGLGRPLQTVYKQASPSTTPKDIVTAFVYDEFGRQVVSFLPYTQTTGSNTADGSFKLNPFSDQDYFYKNLYKDSENQLMFLGESVFYSKNVFENSPLNRTVKTMAPGNSWAGGSGNGIGIEYKFLLNNEYDQVRIWDGNASSNVYEEGELLKQVIIDEQGNAVVEYKDKDGLVILKKVQSGVIPSDYSGHSNFLCTYYIYDDFNQLVLVIPPKAVEALSSTWEASQNLLDELCFQYKYDKRKRMIEKKV